MPVSISIADLVLLPVLIGYTIWWTYDLRKGARVRRSTLGLHLVVYGLAAFYVWAVSLGEIVLAGGASGSVTWIWTLALSAVGVVAAEAGMWYGEHHMVVERAEGGRWHYRGPVAIAIFWLGLYLARFGLEDGLLGGYSVFLPPGPGPPPAVSLGTFLGTVLLVASLYLVSFGFLLGITLSIWHHHRRLLATAAPVRESSTAKGPSSFAAVPPSPSDLGRGTAARPVNVLLPGAAERRCPTCGHTGGTGGAYCGECGQLLPPPGGGP